MKNDKENSQEVNIETNNDAVLYSVMLVFLERKAKEKKLPFDDLYLQIDSKSKTIDLYFVDSKDSQPLFLDETNINEV